MNSTTHDRPLTPVALCSIILLSLLGPTAYAAAPIDRTLPQGMGLSGLTPETPFGDAIDMLRYSVDPPLKIVVNWRDLEDTLGIDRYTPVMMDPISGVKLSTALSLLLWAVSGGTGEIDYTVQNGIILVATTGSIRPIYQTHVYDIGTLLAQPANYQIPPVMALMLGQITTGMGGGYGQGYGGGYGQGYGGYGTGSYGGWPAGGYGSGGYGPGASVPDARAQKLVDIIKQTIAPDLWDESGHDSTSVTHSDGKLIVRHTPQTLKNVSNFIANLQESLRPKIALGVRLFEVPPGFLDDIAIDMDALSDPNQLKITLSPPDPNRKMEGTSLACRGLILQQPQVEAILKSARTYGETKMLVAPTVKVPGGAIVPYLPPISSSTDAYSGEIEPFVGLNFTITPTIDDTNQTISLHIQTIPDNNKSFDSDAKAQDSDDASLSVYCIANLPRRSSLMLAGFQKAGVQDTKSHITLITPKNISEE